MQLLSERQQKIASKLKHQLRPVDPLDACSAIMEIVPGVGGDESCLFVEILFQIYTKYAKQRHWEIELVELQTGNQGGFKTLTLGIKGKGVYGILRHESGTHKIQRISPTDSAKRMHTSAAMVIVFPEIESQEITLNKSDVRVDRFRSGGPGGQATNKIETGVRLTHLPTGIVVRCEGRSQHANLNRAWQILDSRVRDYHHQIEAQKQASQRKCIVGSGDRSQRIRTYNFPQNRVTDYRGPVTVNLEDILAGELDLLESARTTEPPMESESP